MDGIKEIGRREDAYQRSGRAEEMQRLTTKGPVDTAFTGHPPSLPSRWQLHRAIIWSVTLTRSDFYNEYSAYLLRQTSQLLCDRYTMSFTSRHCMHARIYPLVPISLTLCFYTLSFILEHPSPMHLSVYFTSLNSGPYPS